MRRAGNQFKRSFESERSTLSQNDLEMGTQLVIYEETDERKKLRQHVERLLITDLPAGGVR